MKISRHPLVALSLALLGCAHSFAQIASVALPPIETAVSDEKGRIVVNGKPFFPILLYSVPTDPESLKRIHDHGFNMVTVAKADDAEAARAAGMYAAAHGRKIEKFDSVLLAIGMDSPVLNLKPPLLDNLKADLEKTRSQIPNRPVMHAIGYWLDEPAGVVAGTPPPPENQRMSCQCSVDVFLTPSAIRCETVYEFQQGGGHSSRRKIQIPQPARSLGKWRGINVGKHVQILRFFEKHIVPTGPHLEWVVGLIVQCKGDAATRICRFPPVLSIGVPRSPPLENDSPAQLRDESKIIRGFLNSIHRHSAFAHECQPSVLGPFCISGKTIQKSVAIRTPLKI